jgi:hypothetical protein
MVGNLEKTTCYAGLASARRIHPPPFGPPPSLRGHSLTVIFNYEITNKHAAFRGSAAEPQLSILNVTLSFAAKPLTHYSTKEFL